MLDVNTLMEAARRHFESVGLECSVRLENSPLVAADATIALRWGASRQRFAVHAMDPVRMEGVLAARVEQGGMVVAPWISPAMGRKLSGAGVAWADSVGNMAVRFGMVVVEINGRPRPAPRASNGTSVRTVSLMTAANVKILAAIVDDPALGAASLRVLAERAQVSLGQAHKAVSLLASAGYHRDRLGPDQLVALGDLVRVAQSRP